MSSIPVSVLVIGGTCCFLAMAGAGGAFLVWMLSSRKKPTCPECGKVNPAGNSFCEQCGTALEQAQ